MPILKFKSEKKNKFDYVISVFNIEMIKSEKEAMLNSLNTSDTNILRAAKLLVYSEFKEQQNKIVIT